MGSETALQLKAQTDQLGRMYDELYAIDDMLVRSTKIITKMAKTVGSDKCVWVFAGLIVLAIVAVIIVKNVGPANALAPKIAT